MMNTFICVDPGTPFGYAAWRYCTNLKSLPQSQWELYLRKAGQLSQAGHTWQGRSAEAGKQLSVLIATIRPGAVYIEEPTYLEGHAAAARGDLVKLCRTVGRMEQVCDHYGIPCLLIPMRDWLGQLSSEQVRHRAAGLLGEEFVEKYPGDHELDAICMGLHVLDVWPK